MHSPNPTTAIIKVEGFRMPDKNSCTMPRGSRRRTAGPYKHRLAKTCNNKFCENEFENVNKYIKLNVCMCVPKRGGILYC